MACYEEGVSEPALLKSINMKTLQKMVVITICIANAYHASPQDMQLNLALTKETVAKKVAESAKMPRYPFGRSGTKIIFDKGSGNNFMLLYLNEQNFTFLPYGKEILVPKERKLYAFNIMDSLIFYTEAFFDVNNPSDDGYSQLIVRIFDKEILLDSIVNADKRIHSSFSEDSKYLIINTFNELVWMYNPKQDDQFIVYDVDELRRGKVTRSVIPCQYCAFGHLVNNKLFFTHSSERIDNAWRDIYVAPWGKLKDSVKIAFRSNIIAISPDGRYILAENFDLPNGVCLIIDVRTKKYQLLLGRDYHKHAAFYSYEKEKFAFDFGSHIIYVDFPEKYPFDALKNNLQLWGKSSEIREQFQHKPLE
jgi:hypothetical protein